MYIAMAPWSWGPGGQGSHGSCERRGEGGLARARLCWGMRRQALAVRECGRAGQWPPQIGPPLPPPSAHEEAKCQAPPPKP